MFFSAAAPVYMLDIRAHNTSNFSVMKTLLSLCERDVGIISLGLTAVISLNVCSCVCLYIQVNVCKSVSLQYLMYMSLCTQTDLIKYAT